MLPCVFQIITNFVVVCWKQLPVAARQNRLLRVVRAKAIKTKATCWKTLKLSTELKGSGESNNNSLCVYHYKQLLTSSKLLYSTRLFWMNSSSSSSSSGGCSSITNGTSDISVEEVQRRQVHCVVLFTTSQNNIKWFRLLPFMPLSDFTWE